MKRWNEASESCRRDSNSAAQLDRWVERTRDYLRSRTLDHWLMFVGGLVLGALLV